MPGSFKKKLAHVLLRTGITHALEYFNYTNSGLILAYHRISEETFRIHLDVLSEKYQFISLTEYIQRMKHGESLNRYAVITFDDGTENHVEMASKVGVSNNYPITFFLPTSYLDTGNCYWIHELSKLWDIYKPHHIRMKRERSKTVEQYTLKNVDDLYQLIYTLSSHEERKNLLEIIQSKRQDLQNVENKLEFPKPISWRRVGELAKNELFSFESHSVNHFALNVLEDDEIRFEMKKSIEKIEEATGSCVRHFCYPYGGSSQVGNRAPMIAKEFYDSAVTLCRGRSGPESDPYRLSRIPLYYHDDLALLKFKIALSASV